MPHRLNEFILPYWRQLLLVLVFGTIATLSGLAQPYFTKVLIDDALLQSNFNLLVWISLAMLALMAFSYALNAWTGYQYIKVSAAILFDMRRTVYRHLQKLSPRFYADKRLGDVISRLNNDVGEIQRISADTLLALTSNVLFLVGAVVILLYLNLILSLLTFALLPFIVIALSRVRERLESDTDQVRKRSADIGSFLVETLMGLRTTVVMTAEEREVERFGGHNDRFVSAMLDRQKTSILAGLIPSAGLTVGVLMVFLIGGYQVIQGAMTLGAFVAFISYQSRLIAPIQNIMTLYTNVASLKVSARRVTELLDAAPEVTGGENDFDGPVEEIEFRQVSFRHEREEVLTDATFRIQAGTFSVVTGASGAGKSSIADLLVRLYDPDSGTIVINGLDARLYSLAALRKKVALVEQDTFLFNGTVGDNIRYGGTTRSEVPGFLTVPPDALVGDRGLALSGGEKQSIGIARALARDPEVLILDEATSAMDIDLESKVLSELSRIIKGRTIILITHRAYLTRNADLVFEVVDGRILQAAAPRVERA
jgi:ATP-binding cassette subfamily B protein